MPATGAASTCRHCAARVSTRCWPQRVRECSWQRPGPGDAVALAGSRSIFQADQTTDDLVARAQAGDLHPALPLWGAGQPVASAAVHAGRRGW